MPENDQNVLAYYLNQAKQLADEDQFQKGQEAIAEAYKYAAADEVQRIDQAGRRIREQQNRRIRELENAVEDLLKKAPEKLTQEHEEQARTILAQLRSIHVDNVQMDKLHARWAEHARQAEVQRALVKTERELREAWDSPFLLLSRYDGALSLARQMTREYGDEVPRFRDLEVEAEERRAEALAKSGELTTQATMGQFKALLDEVQRLYDVGEAELPWYEWGTQEIEGQKVRVLVFARLVAAGPEPITHLHRMAQEYEDGKAEEYRQRAQTALPADPVGADERIQQALTGFTYLSADRRADLESYHREHVAPALERRRRANGLIEDARKPGQDEVAGWKLVAEAELLDPHAPDLKKAREELRPRLRVRWSQELSNAEKVLGTGRFEEAEEAAREVLVLSEGDPGLVEPHKAAQEIIARCRADRDLFAFVQDEARRIATLVETDQAQAAKDLEALESRVSGRPQRFQQPLQHARSALQARQTLDNLIADWERRLRSTDPTQWGEEFFGDPQALKPVLDSLETLQDELSSRRSVHVVQSLDRRVGARRHYLLGRSAWQEGLYGRAKTSWEKAINLQGARAWQTYQEGWSQWEAGQPSQAWDRWQAIVDLGGDDVRLCIEWLIQAEDATEVSAALTAAESHREAHRYADAHAELDPWRTRPSPRQSEVIELGDKVEAEWRAELVAKINDTLETLEERPLFMQVVEWVDQLEMLDREKAAEYKVQVFPRIYREWADQKRELRDYAGALRDYDEALRNARGEVHSALARKRRWMKRQLVREKVEALEKDEEWGDAQKELQRLLAEYPDDVPTLHLLVRIALEQGDAARVLRYISDAQRRLEDAERGEDPGLAGLEHPEEMEEWALRLEALRARVQASEAIDEARQLWRNRLQSSSSIRSYRLAREGRDELIKQLRELEAELSEKQKGHVERLSQHPAAEREWTRVRSWLREQFEQRIPREYNQTEGALIRELSQELAKTTAPDVQGLRLRDTHPRQHTMPRWSLGLRILLLSNGRNQAAGECLSEIVAILRRLRTTVDDLSSDQQGPETDTDGSHLKPKAVLERQIEWVENCQAWAAQLDELLGDYNWASGLEEEKSRDSREVHDSASTHKDALIALRRQARQAETRIAVAIASGDSAGAHWGRVNWRRVVEELLHAAPSVTTAAHGPDGPEEPADWTGLGHADAATRWSCWAKAAQTLRAADLSSRPDRAPWQDINEIIKTAGVYEKWDEVLEPLSEVRTQFGRHRLVGWLVNERDRAQTLRNRLVLLSAGLYAEVLAEDSVLALSLMDEMESLDEQDRYGLRGRFVAVDIEGTYWSSWPELRDQLDLQRKQWETASEWWSAVTASALRPWREEKRAEALRLALAADFDQAIALCQDAQVGSLPEGKTNSLGGGLALRPLLSHLDSRPDDRQNPAGYRMSRLAEEAQQWQHDTAESARELEWLLAEEERPRRAEGSPLLMPLGGLRDRYKANLEALRNSIGVLEDMPDRRWLWGRAKKIQRSHCCRLLQELRQWAPNSPDLEELEADIGSCP